MLVGSRQAVERELRVEAEYRCEGQPVLAGLTLAAVLTLREICEPDLRPIPVAAVELVEVFVASVSSMFRLNRFCLSCLLLSTAAETKPRPRSTARKAGYRG